MNLNIIINTTNEFKIIQDSVLNTILWKLRKFNYNTDTDGAHQEASHSILKIETDMLP